VLDKGHGSAYAAGMQTVMARWIFPVSQSPLEGGTLTIEGDRIVAVEPHGQRQADLDLGDVAVIPGLVNAHTHLDLTGVRGVCPPGRVLPEWLLCVIAARRQMTPEQVENDIRQGLAECLRHGTTLIGDISAFGASFPILRDAPLRAVVFRELLGLTEDRARQAWAEAEQWLNSVRTSATCRPGLSPHAPYSVRTTLFERVADHARRDGLPVAIHLAESREEIELLHARSGPFVAFLQDLGVWHPAGLVPGCDDILRVNLGVTSLLLAHGTYLEVSKSLPDATVVYCPRTHAAFGHRPHPFRDLLRQGVRVALGTDSLASNPDLSIWNEVRFLRERYPDVPGDILLRMATLSGAEALGWERETGSLEPGKSADLVVLPLTPSAGDAYTQLFRGPGEVRAVMFRGQWVSQPPTALPPVIDSAYNQNKD
jgi:cytosine/adenosine deaminase-related metal-dependent hydrolase